MRHLALLLLSFAIVTPTLFAQTPPRGRRGVPVRNEGMEASIRVAAERLAFDRKEIERDVAVLRRLRAADNALADAMQPANALQKATEEVDEAHRLMPEFTVLQGVIKMQRVLEDARRSPSSADFGQLRSLLRNEALNPASRVVVRNALRLQEETVAWLKIQQLIADHLHTLSDLSSESLKATEEQ